MAANSKIAAISYTTKLSYIITSISKSVAIKCAILKHNSNPSFRAFSLPAYQLIYQAFSRLWLISDIFYFVLSYRDRIRQRSYFASFDHGRIWQRSYFALFYHGRIWQRTYFAILYHGRIWQRSYRVNVYRDRMWQRNYFALFDHGRMCPGKNSGSASIITSCKNLSS